MKDHKNIKDELQEISPFLANLKKPDDGFEVPQNYFQNLENNIFARIKAEEEVEAWSVSDTEETVIAPTQNWMHRLMKWFVQPQVSLSLAMMIIVGIGFTLFQTNNQTETIEIAQIEWTTDEAIASLTVEEVKEYVEDNVEEFSEELLSEVAEDVIVVDVVEEVVEEIVPVEVAIDVELEDLEEYFEENISDFDEDILLEDY